MSTRKSATPTTRNRTPEFGEFYAPALPLTPALSSRTTSPRLVRLGLFLLASGLIGLALILLVRDSR